MRANSHYASVLVWLCLVTGVSSASAQPASARFEQEHDSPTAKLRREVFDQFRAIDAERPPSWPPIPWLAIAAGLFALSRMFLPPEKERRAEPADEKREAAAQTRSETISRPYYPIPAFADIALPDLSRPAPPAAQVDWLVGPPAVVCKLLTRPPVEAAFWAAMAENPGDDLPRLVYADYLDERGDPLGPLLRDGAAFTMCFWTDDRRGDFVCRSDGGIGWNRTVRDIQTFLNAACRYQVTERYGTLEIERSVRPAQSRLGSAERELQRLSITLESGLPAPPLVNYLLVYLALPQGIEP